jgi:hypothetical protein
VWATLPVLGLAMGVLASGVGIDLLLIGASGLLMFTLERTVGDWMGEQFGPAPATVGFVCILAGFTWFVIDSSDRFLTAAENRGYRGVYYRTGTASAASTDASESDVSASAVSITGGASTSSRNTLPVSSSVSGSQRSARSELSREPSGVGGAEEGPPKRPTPTPSAGTRIVSGGQRPMPIGAQTAIVLNIVPQTVSRGRNVRVEATVTSNGRPVNEGVIEFLVNGVGAKRVAVSRGIAAMAYSSSFAGTYEVRARFLGTYRYQASSNTLRSLIVQ